MTTPIRPRRALRRLALLPAAALFAALCLAGCGDDNRLKGACGLVVDGSGSGDSHTGFDAQGLLKKNVNDFLRESACRRVVFAAITGSSETSNCRERAFDIDPDVQGGAVNRDALRAENRKKVQSLAQGVLDCASKDSRNVTGSDVLGGLQVIAHNRPSGKGTFSVLVISDFAQYDPSTKLSREDLTTAKSRDAVIDRLVREHRVANLRDAKLYTSGYGVLVSDKRGAYADFDQFWTRLLRDKAKAHVDTKTYE